jgi:hypothetical protein
MKTKAILFITFMALSIFTYSQEMKSLFSVEKGKNNTYGAYGGPLISATQINGEWGSLLGGKGGIIINQRIALGGVGMGLVSNNTFVESNTEDGVNEILELGYGAGGIFVEYIFKLNSPVHFSIPLNMMVGGASINEVGSNVELESSYLFVLEPGINIEFNVAKQFIPAINISYRQVFGSSLANVSNKDFSGINIGMVFKFGDF